MPQCRLRISEGAGLIVFPEVEFRLRVGRLVLNLRLIFRLGFEFGCFMLRLSFNAEVEVEAEF